MKLERVNDHQIRCTLTRADLAARQLKLSELAYGSEKAKSLFRDMMQKATYELGFDAEDTPLMIEAVPVSSDSIILIITKVEDPEELDTRFSKFSQNPAFRKTAEDWLSKITSGILEGASLFAQMQSKTRGADTKDAGTDEKSASAPGSSENNPSQEQQSQHEVPQIVPYRAFVFHDLETVFQAASSASFFCGRSSLYRKGEEKTYVLLVFSEGCAPEEFAKACNIIAEYGRMLHTAGSAAAYYDEHYRLISGEQAIQKLSRI